ncbi:MAG: type II toxin-antitoxin system VapC family toxin [Oceanipulchritudo sp.]|jgi:tRNA(fMet)-specific endonuclease VapC
MKYLLDTDTCIALLRGHASAVSRASNHAPDELAFSSITRYELLYGVRRCKARTRKREADKVEQFLGVLHEIPFTGETADLAAGIRFDLEAKGKTIGPMDTLIAATALQAGLTLVSGNMREFGRVDRLTTESWMATGENL